MFGSDGEVKLIDFGLSLIRKGSYNRIKMGGTPYYFAPEVINQSYGKECDIWSLGVCIYQLLTGDMPFNARDQEALFQKI